MANFGIHVGNSSACIAVISNKAASVIANDAGDRVTPAYLALNDKEWEIGLPAKSGQARNKSVITSNKRLLDTEFDNVDVFSVENASTCKVIINDDNKIKYEFNSGDNCVYCTPEDISTKIYGKLFTIATHAVQTDSDLKVVLAVPLHWSLESEQNLIKCAELAGFQVMHVTTEPAAAVLAYEPYNNKTNILVYRLGGTSCDASIVHVDKGMYEVRNSVYKKDLGGKQLTEDLAEFIACEFQKKYKLDPKESKRSMKKLLHHADNCKHILSTMSSAHVFIESLIDGVDWSQNISRARFENIISNRLNDYLGPIHEVLEGFEDIKIDKIIICGGSMKIPKLQYAVTNMFPDAEFLSSISSDEVIANGCACHAGALEEYADLDLNGLRTAKIECLENPIFINYMNKSICLFDKGTPIDSKVSLVCGGDTNSNEELDVTITDAENSYNEHIKLKSPFTLNATLLQNKISIDTA